MVREFSETNLHSAGIMMHVQPAPVIMMQQPAPTMIIMGGGQP